MMVWNMYLRLQTYGYFGPFWGIDMLDFRRVSSKLRMLTPGFYYVQQGSSQNFSAATVKHHPGGQDGIPGPRSLAT